MTRPWQAEHDVSAADAARLAGTQFPQLAGAPVVPLASGWDNTVHLVGGTWVFRLRRRAVALPGFLRETALLPALAPRLPLRGPPGGRQVATRTDVLLWTDRTRHRLRRCGERPV